MTSLSISLQRRFFRLAIPNILSNVTVPLVGLVDTAFLGHLPNIDFLAGVALGAVIFDYAYWTFGFLRMGTTGTTAQAVGRGDHLEICNILYRSLVAALAVAVVLLLARDLIRDVGFAVLSGSPGVEQAGADYFNARIWGAPATLSNYVLLGWLLGRERAREALLITVVGNLANVGLDYLFIVEFGWAATGAGVATAASQYLMLLVGAVFVCRAGPLAPFSGVAVFDRERLSALFRLNRDILVRTLALLTTFALFTNFSALISTTVLAANAILIRLHLVAAYLIDGAAFATESLAGIYYGQRDVDRLRRVLRLAMMTGLAFAVLALAVLLLVPGTVFGIMTSHTAVIAAAQRYMPWMVPMLMFASMAYIYDGFFIGITEGKVLRNQMVISALVFFLPVAWVAVRRGDNDLLWAAIVLFTIGRVITMWIGERRVFHRLEGLQ
ncbi:MAG TPA: MATE family efflux transporter [Acidobacteriota bacterium]|nr:MATE family efflux transporter [Acidobacteriota bacterium]